MNDKGFEADMHLNETPIFKDTVEKPLKDNKRYTKKVDINILKSRIEVAQKKENKKNISIFIFSLSILGILAIYLSK
tara:strand:+ start:476 stop:706 length:231 start_codon:yes stop_codon:yes gene_type:complete